MTQVDLPDGRVLEFRDAQVVGFNLFEAQRRAGRGARARSQAVADLYRRDDGMWEVSDPIKELDFMGDLAAAVLLSYAALEGLPDGTLNQLEEGTTLSGRLLRLRGLRDRLVDPGIDPLGPGIFGLLLRGDADTCAEDAIAVVRALRPELAPSALLQAP